VQNAPDFDAWVGVRIRMAFGVLSSNQVVVTLRA
jgi:hypothetical protein